MAQAAFDTLQYVEKLKDAGFSELQAKTMSEVQKEVISQVIGTQVATKLDLIAVKADLKSEIARVETDLKSSITALDNKINKVETELKLDIAALDKKIDKVESKVDHLEVVFNGKFSLLYWMLGFSLAITTAILFKLIIH